MIDLRQIIKTVPAVKPYLTGKAKWLAYEPAEYKTFDYMLAQLLGLIRGVYGNNLGGDFIDIMANLISGQLTQAYQQAFEDAGYTGFFLPDYLQASLEEAILNQYGYVDQLFRDIIDARLNGEPVEPLLARAQLWAQRWTEGYNEATRLITTEEGGNLEWVLGATEQHCSTCSGLNGKVMSSKEWDLIGIKPQNAPNSALECGGWRCDCSLVPTDKRRSPGAYGRIEEMQLSLA
jgi:hypothetical protein